MLRRVLSSRAQFVRAWCLLLGSRCSVHGAPVCSLVLRAACFAACPVRALSSRALGSCCLVLGAQRRTPRCSMTNTWWTNEVVVPVCALGVRRLVLGARCQVRARFTCPASCHACGAQGGVLRRVLSSRAQFARAWCLLLGSRCSVHGTCLVRAADVLRTACCMLRFALSAFRALRLHGSGRGESRMPPPTLIKCRARRATRDRRPHRCTPSWRRPRLTRWATRSPCPRRCRHALLSSTRKLVRARTGEEYPTQVWSSPSPHGEVAWHCLSCARGVATR